MSDADGWFDQPPEPLTDPPGWDWADRVLAAVGVALLLLAVAVLVALWVAAGRAQGTWALAW